MGRVFGLNGPTSIWEPEAGIGVLKNRHLWQRVQLTQPMFDGNLAGVDRMMGALSSNGIPIVPILKYEGQGRPTDAATWGKWNYFLERVVKRYHWQPRWQIWNEPNMHASVAGGGFPDPATWKTFLSHSHNNIKKHNPKAMTIAGGIAIGGLRYPKASSWRDSWIRASAVCDRTSIHTYSYDPYWAAYAIRRASNVSEAAGRHLWVTELGADSGRLGLVGQQHWCKYVIEHTGKRPLFWFNFMEHPGAGWPPGLGLVRQDGSGKPAWYTYVRAAAAAL